MISQLIAALVLGVLTFVLPILLPVTAFVLFSDIDAALTRRTIRPRAALEPGC